MSERETDGVELGLGLQLGLCCRATHGSAANVRRPFADIPLVMHELYEGGSAASEVPPFRGQFGIIPFSFELRLPRHVHMAEPEDGEPPRIIAERILVLNGAGLVELAGTIFLIAPNTLVHIAPGVPHTWTACPPGVRLPDDTVTDGRFLMVYEYPERTRFYPTASAVPIRDAAEYQPHSGDLESIRFPLLGAAEVTGHVPCVWGRTLLRDLKLAE